MWWDATLLVFGFGVGFGFNLVITGIRDLWYTTEVIRAKAKNARTRIEADPDEMKELEALERLWKMRPRKDDER